MTDYNDKLCDQLDNDIVLCSMANLARIVKSKQYLRFVWPDEGEFIDNRWQFNATHRAENFQPLIIDMISANSLLTVYQRLSPDNAKKFKNMLESDRGSFGYWCEKIFYI